MTIQILYPSKDISHKQVEEENWINSDGVRLDFRAARRSTAPNMSSYVRNDGKMDATITSLSNQRISLHFKVDLNTWSTGGSISVWLSNSTSSSTYLLNISAEAFSGVGINDGIVAISVLTNASGQLLVSHLTSDSQTEGVFLNGHKTTYGVEMETNTGYGYCNLTIPDGMAFASVFAAIGEDAKKRRWWYVKNLNVTSQESGELDVDAEDFTDNTFNTDLDYEVKFNTDFVRREGSTILGAIHDIRSRFNRRSAQFAINYVRSRFGDDVTKRSGNSYTSDTGYKMTLLDMSDQTVNLWSRSAHKVGMADEDLQTVTLISDMEHVVYTTED